MAVTGTRRSGMAGGLLVLAFVAGGVAHAQTSTSASAAASMPTEPLDEAGQPCGALRALPADVSHYRYEVSNRCERPVTFSWRCNATDTEHSLDLQAKGTQSATCVKATGAAGEIVFRFGPPGTGR